MEEYLRIIERHDKGKLRDSQFDVKNTEWTEQFKRLMPKQHRVEFIPIFFSYIDSERLGQAVIKNKEIKDFLMVS